MKFIKKHKTKILIGLIAIAVLTLAYFWGGNEQSQTAKNVENSVVTEKAEGGVAPDKKAKPRQATNEDEVLLQKDEYQTDPVPSGMPRPKEPQHASISETEHRCTLSVRCDTIYDNINSFNPEKIEILPKNGVIFEEQSVVFYEGESVFNVLVREMKKHKIHMEFENTPIYNSAYIEGIGNIYEFDCGTLSGWMYRVNGWFPNYGASRYELSNGDKIEWIYTCDLGRDIGGDTSPRNGFEGNE